MKSKEQSDDIIRLIFGYYVRSQLEWDVPFRILLVRRGIVSRRKEGSGYFHAIRVVSN